MRAHFVVPVVALSLGLTACQGGNRWADRYGPEPVLVAADVKKSSEELGWVFQYLAQAAGRPWPVEDDTSDWYWITVAGFNYVDEKCDTYLRNVFIRARERDRLKNGITAADKSTGAILSVTDVPKATVAIVAQIFGLGASATSVIFDSYLFAGNPSLVYSTVAKLQKAYRDKVAAEQKASAAVMSGPEAYGRIRGYLQLCMPQTIESKISDLVASAEATPVKNTSASESTKDKSVRAGDESADGAVDVKLTGQTQ
jgi:hypothetical protein